MNGRLSIPEESAAASYRPMTLTSDSHEWRAVISCVVMRSLPVSVVGGVHWSVLAKKSR